jgi:hypothetical protein
MNHPEEETEKPEISCQGDFISLITKETDDLKDPSDAPPHQTISTPGKADEPWVSSTSADYLGLALSGGGVRSATFNLGLLQALSKKDILSRVNYLATVSGGGYIGAFWTRWRHHQNGKTPLADSFFPWAITDKSRLATDPPEIREAPEIRHLRENSRFLIPRKGFNKEFLEAVKCILEGFISSITAAFTLVVLITCLWSWLAYLVIRLSASSGTVATIVGVLAWVLAILFWMPKRETGQTDSFSPDPKKMSSAISVLVCMTLSLAGGAWAWIAFVNTGIHGRSELGWGSAIPAAYAFNHFLAAPCVALAAILVLLIFQRLIIRRFMKGDPDLADTTLYNPSDPMDRFMVWLLGALIYWAVFTAIWEVAVWLHVKATSLKPTGGVMAVLGMLFIWLRNWLKKEPWKEGNIGWLDRFKPYVPIILANAIVVLMFILSAVFILEHGMVKAACPNFWMTVTLVLAMLLVLLLYDPSKLGLHAFYRAKLTECYLKAGRIESQTQNPNPQSSEKMSDDIGLKEDTGKPLHLICCAANHLHGNLINNLHRGARSAVLSRNGITIGNYYNDDGGLSISSAITASAAAINSMMGGKSIALGPAVAFVMTAFSIRLGLWVPNPAYNPPEKSDPTKAEPHRFKYAEKLFKYSDKLTYAAKGAWYFLMSPRYLPGILFIKELLGWSRTGANGDPYIHLSDGGHFENLALYELIRRHCRYIIVSDAGMDKDFTFGDFGRAVRRVREDFGVEIEIDFDPLRPGKDGLSHQHIAVGSIHYDGLTGTDKGTIIYIKPVLTGDEPVDLYEHHCSNKAFPHDPTLDQFFDEAQWESYRRLGEHAGNASLCMLSGADKEDPTERIFRKIRLYWHRTPWTIGEGGVRLCDHKADLEKLISDSSPQLLKELYGEIQGSQDEWVPGETIQDILEDVTKCSEKNQLGNLMVAHRIFLFLEEAWYVCELDRYWAHPLAGAWMAYLHRLSRMPSIRCWWLILRPMYGSDFQLFADKRLHLMPAGGLSSMVVIEKIIGTGKAFDSGYASRRFMELWPDFEPKANQTKYRMLFWVPGTRDKDRISIEVGFLLVEIAGNTARWRSSELFIPPELSGGGLTTQFLDGIIKNFENKKDLNILRMEVLLLDEPELPKDALKTQLPPLATQGPAERQRIIELIDFYKSRKFHFDGDARDDGEQRRLVRAKQIRSSCQPSIGF